MPSLMTRMLDTLDIHEGHRVLEIGTGTGYNAALLSHRLGSEQVFSVDIEPELIELARQRLAGLGYRPTLAATDGEYGLPEHAPYDRIIATCSVPAIPQAWIAQSRDGGLILADVKIGKQAGNLVLLHRDGNVAEGRFDHTDGSFMALRRAGDTYELHPVAVAQHRDSAHRRSTTLGLTRPWEHSAFWFFAQFTLPPGTSFRLCAAGPGQPPRNTVLHSPDGSWCEVSDDADNGTCHVWETGPHLLWRIIENTHRTWVTLGQPGWERFGLTATPDRQWIWLDSPTGEYTWTVTWRGWPG
jgi:protein-L-isoaspartate O-methyltransferase